jgi:hypothetical protein
MMGANAAPPVVSRFSTFLPYVLFVVSLGFFLYAAQLGWRTSLLEDQGFRQTQTAISAYYMAEQGPKLAYETPVLGPPWSVPFEFPLYQGLVAAAAAGLHTPLDQTGRFLSVAFFLLTLIPANYLLARMKFARDNRLVMLSLLLISPFYVYWSRAFLIESTVLFLSMSYLACSVAFLKAPGCRSGSGAVVTGILASLVKITTFVPFLLGVCLFGCYLAWAKYREDRSWAVPRRLAGQFVFLTAPAFLLLVWWTHFADAVKELSHLGHWMTSGTLTTWIFGTWDDRVSLTEWSLILTRFGLIVGHFACVVFCVPGLWFGGRRLHVAAALGLALSAPLLFTKLYFHHEYYAYANGVFLLAAVGMGLVVLRERGGWCRRAAHVGLLVFAAAGLVRYHHYFYPKQTSHATKRWLEELFAVIREETQPEDVVVAMGSDWSAEIPYYSHRRALMIPNWKLYEFAQDPQTYLKDLEGYRIGALVVYNPTVKRVAPGTVPRVVEAAHLNPSGRSARGDLYTVYSAKAPGHDR